MSLPDLVVHQIAAAEAALGDNCDPALAVHGARKRLKGVRALLWAIEPKIGKPAKKARRKLGAAARKLAKARDANVVAATAAGIGFGDAAESLRFNAEEAHRRAPPLGRIRRDVAAIARPLAKSTRRFDEAATLNAALRRCYRHGRRAMETCRRDPTTENLHAWRKQVKRLYYLVVLTTPRLGRDGAQTAKLLDKLGDTLGLDHDHAILAERLKGTAFDGKARRAAIAAKRADLQAEVFRLGDTVYAAKPRAFVADLATAHRQAA